MALTFGTRLGPYEVVEPLGAGGRGEVYRARDTRLGREYQPTRNRKIVSAGWFEDLKKFDVPTLILHGDDDQIVPIGGAGLMSAKIVKNATLKVYPGFPHGMPRTNADQINDELLAFFKGEKSPAA